MADAWDTRSLTTDSDLPDFVFPEAYQEAIVERAVVMALGADMDERISPTIAQLKETEALLSEWKDDNSPGHRTIIGGWKAMNDGFYAYTNKRRGALTIYPRV